jgi:hypothetical protein
LNRTEVRSRNGIVLTLGNVRKAHRQSKKLARMLIALLGHQPQRYLPAFPGSGSAINGLRKATILEAAYVTAG